MSHRLFGTRRAPRRRRIAVPAPESVPESDQTEPLFGDLQADDRNRVAVDIGWFESAAGTRVIDLTVDDDPPPLEWRAAAPPAAIRWSPPVSMPG
jgi:hypothetical protein